MASSDVIIIGGGINGVSTAFHLAKAGVRVTLLEKTFIAGGPTGKSSAIVRQHYSNPVTARMALKSLRFWQNFTEITGGGDCGFTQTGFLIGVRPQDVDGLKQNIAMQQSVGIQTQFVTPEEMREIEPHLNPDELGGGAYEPESGYCAPAMAANGFAEAVKRLGGEIRTGVRVTAIRTEGGRATGVESTAGFFPAGAVVVAAGPWTPALLAPLGVDVPIIAARVKIGLFKRPAALDRHRVWGDFVTQIYLRPESGDLMLVGSLSPEEAEDRVSDPDHYNERVSLDILTDFAEQAARRYPLMERGHLAGNYAALYDVTPDWHHILDAVPGVDGLYLCAGGSGHGFKLSPAVGEMMANLVLHGKSPDDDVHLFAFDRFQRDALVRGQYEYSIIG